MEGKYRIRRIYKRTLRGSTAPFRASLDAILKTDSAESPNAVYNEIVALRLGQFIGAPVADGGLVNLNDGEAFASLELAWPGVPLPDLPDNWRFGVSYAYQSEVAALIVLDVWIGNCDRTGNLKASLDRQALEFFHGFDHGHALLNIGDTPAESIEQLLSGDLIVAAHPFFGMASRDDVSTFVKRAQSITDSQIEQICTKNKAFRDVDLATQHNVASALSVRRDHLDKIFDLHANTIFRPK